MRGRPNPTVRTLDEVLAQALASAQAVTTRATSYAQQLGAALAAPRDAAPTAPPPDAAPTPAAHAMTQEAFGRVRDHSQRVVDRLRETERRIAAGYDRVAQALVARVADKPRGP
jgi:hypothetical protein